MCMCKGFLIIVGYFKIFKDFFSLFLFSFDKNIQCHVQLIASFIGNKPDIMFTWNIFISLCTAVNKHL